METTNIYTLKDPRDQQIRYVGKANNISQRYKAHLNNSNNPTSHKNNWIALLKHLGLKPIMEIIEIVPIEEWIFWERYWISQFKTWGFDLTNHKDGGDGPTFGNRTSFKYGHIPWNKNKGNIKICKICSSEFKSQLSSGRNTCSKPCSTKLKKETPNKGRFSKNKVPWNKGKKGLKLRPDKNVHQYSKDKQKFIKTWKTAKEASIILKINEDGIGQCSRNKSKSSGNFWWTYIKI